MPYSLNYYDSHIYIDDVRNIIGEFSLSFDFKCSLYQNNYFVTIMLSVLDKTISLYSNVYNDEMIPFDPYIMEKVCKKVNKAFSQYSCGKDWITIGDKTYEDNELKQGVDIVEELIKKELNTDEDIR